MPAPPVPAGETSTPDTLVERLACGFYTVANSSYFVGVVSLINSLRLLGHKEAIFVADCGLSAAQRRMLAGEATLVDGANVDAPHFAKTVAPLAHPSDVMVLIDADIIVTRPLTELIEEGRSGKVVAFADEVAHRFDPRWSELLGLGGLRHQPYVNSGLVVVPHTLGVGILMQVRRGLPRVEVRRTIVGEGTSDYPFFYLDQDVLNAVLSTRPAESINILDHGLAPFPPFHGLQLIDSGSLRCVYRDGREPFALHHVLRKPWLVPTRPNVYSRLLSRLLLESDVAIRLDEDDVPLRFRGGAASWLERRRVDVVVAALELRSKARLLRGRLSRSDVRAVA
jgi:hypothetical protein